MAEPVIRGWCPGALRPMLSGDGWVVRLRVPMGRLSEDQARGVAALARAHGNGLIDLSSRANLQLRGVTEAGHTPLIHGLRALGLVDDSAETEARRNLTITPFWQAGDATERLAIDLTQALVWDAPDLPGKFGFAADTGPSPVLQTTPADIRLERDTAGGLILRADGMALGLPVGEATAVAQAMALARWFVASGGMRDGRGRMAGLIAAGVRPDGHTVAPAQPALPPLPGDIAGGTLVALAFGQIEAGTLALLADHGPIRLTPWRMLLVEGATNLPMIPGLIRDADDPLLSVIACTGAPGCPQAFGSTRDIARQLAPHLQGRLLHVSGCAKGCAHPRSADVTLTATGAGFDLIRGGIACAPPVRTGLTRDALFARPATLFECP